MGTGDILLGVTGMGCQIPSKGHSISNAHMPY